MLMTRITENGTKETEPMFKHLFEQEMFKECCWLYSLLSLFNENEHDHISFMSQFFYVVLQNHEILHNSHN